jgi:hypothetical protein
MRFGRTTQMQASFSAIAQKLMWAEGTWGVVGAHLWMISWSAASDAKDWPTQSLWLLPNLHETTTPLETVNNQPLKTEHASYQSVKRCSTKSSVPAGITQQLTTSGSSSMGCANHHFLSAQPSHQPSPCSIQDAV